MDIQSKKLLFLREYLKLTDEELIDKLNKLLRSERRKKVEKELKPYSTDHFNALINSAEEDIKHGKVTSARELNNEIDSWS